MDWQQMAALLIVGVTASVFILSKTQARRRGFSLKRDTHCGCSSAGDLGAKQTIRFSARKGERPRIIVKNG